MKKGIAMLLCALIFTGMCFASDPVEGFWISYDDKTGKATAGWEIYSKDGILFGEIRSLAGFPLDAKADKVKDSYKGFPRAGKVNEMTTCNTPWIWGLKQDKPGVWSGGNIIDPGDGNMYKCKITFRAQDGKKYTVDTLEMRGEIGLGIGKSQYWQKATKEQAFGLR